MANKIDIFEIKLASCSQYDVAGRVFFAQGRVFRAISYGAADEVQEFMHSPLFAELIRRHWIPNTWITEDVEIPETAFCLEHERLFDSHAKEWSFEMMKDAALFTIRLDALCKKYGYVIKDALFDNICFCKGKPCWIDFGSFRKREPLGQPLYRFYFVWNIYIYLSMFVQGADMVARSLLNGWLIEKPFVMPDQSPEYIKELWWYVKKAVWGYDYYVRVKLPHLRVPRWLQPIVWLIDIVVGCMNWIVRKIAHKDGEWRFIKKVLVYKELQEKDIDSLHANYQKQQMTYPMENGAWLQSVHEYMAKNEAFGKTECRPLLLGNYKAEDAAGCFLGRECTIVSSDEVYVDNLYHEVSDKGYWINPICTNIFAPQIDESTRKLLRSDIVVVGDMLKEWEYPTTPDNAMQPPRDFVAIIEHISQYVSDLLIVPMQEDRHNQIMKLYFDKMDSAENGLLIYRKRKGRLCKATANILQGGVK